LPALLGAGLLSIDGITEPGVYSGTATLVGMFTALVSGYLAIRFLVALVARDRLTVFARYCVLAAIIGIVGYLMIGPPSTV
jgi:undecaprenyl-diphosphatase